MALLLKCHQSCYQVTSSVSGAPSLTSCHFGGGHGGGGRAQGLTLPSQNILTLEPRHWWSRL
jgi:hypothetical protein